MRRRPRVAVRPATLKDLDAVAAMRVALLREEERNPLFADPHPDAEARALSLTRAELEMTDQVVLLATRGQEAIGMLRCRAVRRTPLVTEARQAVVTTAYVMPSERRGGVMRALLAGADRWCRKHHLAGMRLQCALSNEIGRKAWESLGFEPAEVLYVRDVPRD